MFRFDGRIAANNLHATFARWHDRLIAGIMLLAALAALRSWLVDRSWTTAAWAGALGGFVIGMSAGRAVVARLAFHGFDGLLPADALQPKTRGRYMAAWHGIGVVVLAMVALIVRPSPLPVSVAAYVGGAAVAGIADSVPMQLGAFSNVRTARALRAWMYRPVCGLGATAVLLLSLLPAQWLGPNMLLGIVGVEASLFGLALTMVDDVVVRFMAMAGHGAGQIVLRHAKALAAFFALAVPGCWLAAGSAAAAIVAAVTAVVLLLLVLRVLAYRLHGKRFADLLVSILAGLLLLVGYAAPVALPVVLAVMLWRLERRGAVRTWLLA